MFDRNKGTRYLICIILFSVCSFIVLSSVLVSSISVVVGEEARIQEIYVNSFAKQNFDLNSAFSLLFNYGYLKFLPLIIIKNPVIWVGTIMLASLVWVILITKMKEESTKNNRINNRLAAMNDDIDKLLVNQLDQSEFEIINKLKNKCKYDIKIKENEKNELIEYQENMMHEIKNMLAIVNLQVQSGSDQEEILLQLDKVNYLVNTYLKVAKLSSSKMQMQLKTTSVNEILETIIYEYQLQIEGKNIRIVNLLDDAETLWIDSFWVSHAISNVVSNSIEYLDENGVIKLWVEENEYYKELIIEDNGQGIVDINSVFERYYTNSSKGYGIGLSLAAKVMELHRGSLSVISRAEGVRFIFRFPILEVKGKVDNNIVL